MAAEQRRLRNKDKVFCERCFPKSGLGKHLGSTLSRRPLTAARQSGGTPKNGHPDGEEGSR